jgi:hypothetical protein
MGILSEAIKRDFTAKRKKAETPWRTEDGTPIDVYHSPMTVAEAERSGTFERNNDGDFPLLMAYVLSQKLEDKEGNRLLSMQEAEEAVRGGDAKPLMRLFREIYIDEKKPAPPSGAETDSGSSTSEAA